MRIAPPLDEAVLAARRPRARRPASAGRRRRSRQRRPLGACAGRGDGTARRRPRSTARGRGRERRARGPRRRSPRTIGAPIAPSPTKPIGAPLIAHSGSTGAGSAASSSARAARLDRVLGDAERLHRRRHAAVDRGLQQRLLDLLGRAAVADRAARVHAELVRAVERGQHREVDEAALAPRQAGPRPDCAPAVLGDELLHRPRELARVARASARRAARRAPRRARGGPARILRPALRRRSSPGQTSMPPRGLLADLRERACRPPGGRGTPPPRPQLPDRAARPRRRSPRSR